MINAPQSLLFGVGATIAIMFLALVGREAMAKEQAAALLRQIKRERRVAMWKAI